MKKDKLNEKSKFNRWKYFLLLLVIFAFPSFQQSLKAQDSCQNAIVQYVDSKIDYTMSGFEYWVKFKATETELNVQILSPSSGLNADLDEIIIYSGLCDSINPIDTLDLDDSLSTYDQYIIGDEYFIKFSAQTSQSGSFGLDIRQNRAIITNCPLDPCEFIRNGNFDITGAPFNNFNNPFSQNINTSEVCGWGWVSGSPQCKTIAATSNNVAYMWTQGFGNGECIYTTLYNGAAMPAGNYILSFRGILNTPNPGTHNLDVHFEANNTGGPAVGTRLAQASLSPTWSDFSFPVEFGGAGYNTSDIHLKVRPEANLNGVFVSVHVDDFRLTPLDITVTPSSHICPGTPVTIEAISCPDDDQTQFYSYYSWTSNPVDPSLVGQSNLNSITVSPSATTTYTLTFSNTYGVQYTEDVIITVLPEPTAEPILTGIFNNCNGTELYEISNYNSTYNYSYVIKNPSTSLPAVVCGQNFIIDWNNYAGMFQNGILEIEIIATVPSSNCSKSASYFVAECCQNGDDYNNHKFQNSTAFSGQTVSFNGVNTIESGVQVIFNGCDVFFGPDAKIIVEDGATIILEGNVLTSCFNAMWDGIYAEGPDALIDADANEIYDAKNAIVSINGGRYELDQNIFDQNHIGVLAKDFHGDHLGYIHGNEFKTTSPISKSPYVGQNGYCGVKVINVIKDTDPGLLKIGLDGGKYYTNTFLTLDHGIVVENSDVLIRNNKLEELVNGITIAGNDNTLPFASGNVRECIIGGDQPYQPNSFKAMTYGIDGTAKSDIYVHSNSFTEIYNPIRVFGSNDTKINIISNKMTSIQYMGVNITDIRSEINIHSNLIVDGMQQIWVSQNMSDLYFAATTNICNNTLQNSQIGIVVNNTGETSVNTNSITFSGSYPSNTLIGIYNMNQLGSNVDFNTVNHPTVPTSGGSPSVLGVFSQVSPYSYIRANSFTNTKVGMQMYGDHQNTQFHCNTFWSNYNVFNFGNATIGFNNNVGSISVPWDNQWFSNVSSVYLTGNVNNPINVSWYYWPGAPMFNIPATANNVAGITTFTSTNGNQCGTVLTYPQCLNNPTPVIPYGLKLIPSDSLRNLLFGGVLNTFDTFNQNNNGFNGLLYGSNNKYQIIRDTYNKLMENQSFLSLGSTNDLQYQLFVGLIGNTNIGKSISLKTAQSECDNDEIINILQNFIPVSVAEQNTKAVFEIYSRSWGVGEMELSSIDSLTLYNIAIQDPEIGGHEVFMARDMLKMLIMPNGNSISPKLHESSNGEILNCKVYPNPNNGKVFIELEEPMNSEIVFELYDLQGKKIVNTTFNDATLHSINLVNIEQGMYIYKIYTTNGKIKTGKIIVE